MGNVVLLCFVIIENCHQPTAEVMEGWVPNYVGDRGESILFFFLTRLLNGSILLLGISGFIPTFTFLCLNGDLLSYLD